MVSVIFRVVRAKNLVVVALTMYLMRFGIIQPILQQGGLKLQLSEWLFLFLTLSTVFITAAGYVINDYFDTHTDLINRPQTVVVGRQLSRRMAIMLHWILNIAGFILGTIVSFAIGKPFLSLAFLIIPGFLWFYSTTYKRQFLIGNIVVAFLTGLVPAMTIIFELPALYEKYWQLILLSPELFNKAIFWVVGFSIFAFILNLFREIIKDVEDFEGDIEFGRNTLPVVLGTKATQIVAASLLLVVVVLITYLFGVHLNQTPNGKFDFVTFIYMFFGLVIPIFYMLMKLFSAEKKEHYHHISRMAKYIMLVGILYSLVFRFFIA